MCDSKAAVGIPKGVAKQTDDISETQQQLQTMEVGTDAHTPDTTLQKYNEIRRKMTDSFDADWFAPDMAFCRILHNPINPHIQVKANSIDLTVGLPVSFRDVRTLVDLCQELEHENVDQALRDQAVRTGWILPPEVVHFLNPSFNGVFKSYSRGIASHLRMTREEDVTDGLQIVFTGLVLQPPCASNEPLELTPKTDDACGTIVIILPTYHTGGMVRLSKEQLAMEFCSSEVSTFSNSVVAWWAGVEAMFRPVESGCRVMLTWDIVLPNKPQLKSIASLQAGKDIMADVLSGFRNGYSSASGIVPGVFAHTVRYNTRFEGRDHDPLEHHHKDLLRVLEETCSEVDLHVYLTNIQGTVTTSVLGTSIFIQLNQVLHFDGTLMAQFVKIEKENLLQSLQETFGDYGVRSLNTNGEDTVTYEALAILIVVPTCYPALILNPDNPGRVNAHAWLLQAIEAAKNAPYGQVSREQLRHGCRYIAAEYSAFKEGRKPHDEEPFSHEVIYLTIKASAYTDELDLSFCLEELTTESYVEIGAFITKNGFSAVQNSLSIGLSKLPGVCTRKFVFDELDTNVQAATSEPNPDTMSAMALWRQQQAEVSLRGCILETGDDAYCLVLMAGRHGSHFLLSRVLDAVRRHKSSPKFQLEFLNRLAPGRREQNLCKDAVRNSFQVVLEDLMPSLWMKGGLEKSRMRLRNAVSACPSSDQDPTPRQIVELMVNCLDVGLPDAITPIVLQLIDEEKMSVGTEEFETIYIPFLKHMLEELQELQSMKNKQRRVYNGRPEFENIPIFKKLFRKMVQSHLERLKSPDPPLPANPKDWVKAKKGCNDLSCRDCRKLDRFLQDPSKRQERFRGNLQRRRHVEERVRGQAQTVTDPNATEFDFIFLDDPYPGVLVVGKSHKDFQCQIKSWSENCNLALHVLDRELVNHGTGGHIVLGDVITLFEDLRELTKVKLLVMQASVDLCMKESTWAGMSTGRN